MVLVYPFCVPSSGLRTATDAPRTVGSSNVFAGRHSVGVFDRRPGVRPHVGPKAPLA